MFAARPGAGPGGAEGDEAVGFGFDVGDFDVEVHAVLDGLGLGDALEEQLGPWSTVGEERDVGASGAEVEVAQGGRPELGEACGVALQVPAAPTRCKAFISGVAYDLLASPSPGDHRRSDLDKTDPAGKADRPEKDKDVSVTVRTPGGASESFDFKDNTRVDTVIREAVTHFVGTRELAAGDYGLALVRSGAATPLDDIARLDEVGVVDGDMSERQLEARRHGGERDAHRDFYRCPTPAVRRAGAPTLGGAGAPSRAAVEVRSRAGGGSLAPDRDRR